VNCPHCQSDNTARARRIWEGGTEETTTTGMYTYGKVTTPYTKTALKQTPLAKQMSPPTTSSVGFPIVLAALAIFVIATSLSSPMLKFTLVAFAVVFAGYAASKANEYNTKILPSLLAEWEKKWFCRGCLREFQEP
jgi:hypothetical protein